jgi:putative DNA primase/helicase
MNLPPFSDQAIALECAARFGDEWRFVADTNEWLHWNGSRWEPDRRKAIAAPVATICAENAARVVGDGRLARSVASDARIRTVISCLSRDQRMVVTADQLDADKHLLGTPAGFVDLETGKSYAADAGRLITMSTSVEPASEGVHCPHFIKFLESTYPLLPDIDAPDEKLIDFLWRFTGSSLTAHVSDHTFIFLLGGGGNGKAVLTHTLEGILGDYASVLNAESLMERAVEPHLAEFADLPRKRLILCREVSPGRYWNYSRLMGLVAGDSMRANLMRQNPFTFHPVGKIVIEANNRPSFRVVTPAVERRLALVRHPMWFVRSDRMEEFLKNHPDLRGDSRVVEAIPDLEEQLKAEYPAILRWMIDGAVEWHRSGLQIPSSVLSDSTEYIQDQDDLGTWCRESCQRVPGRGDPRKDLFQAFCLWSEQRGQKPISYREFGNHLRDTHGFKIAHQSYGDQVVGLVLNDFSRAALLRHRAETTKQGHRYEEAMS